MKLTRVLENFWGHPINHLNKTYLERGTLITPEFGGFNLRNTRGSKHSELFFQDFPMAPISLNCPKRSHFDLVLPYIKL